MNRETYQATYRALRCRARTAQARRPKNIESVTIVVGDLVFFDTNWPRDEDDTSASPRCVMRKAPRGQPVDQSSPSPLLYGLMVARRTLPKDSRRHLILMVRRAPALPIPR